MNNFRPTSRDVAKRAGVGQVTVSRAFTGKSPVAEETRQKIMAAARELGYRPNAAATAMSSGRFGCAALLTGIDLSLNLLPQRTLDAIEAGLAEHDMYAAFARLPDEKLTDASYVPRILRSWMADGLLISYNARIPTAMVELIEEHRLPAVWINSKHEHDCVRPDDFLAGRLATRRLIELGHRRIAFLRPGKPDAQGNLLPSLNHYSATDRFAGYEYEMQEAGLVPRAHTIYVEYEHDDHLAGVKRILEMDERPTGLVVNNEALAPTVCFLASQFGLAVPSDLSVITFAHEFVLGGSLPVDAVRLPDAAIGQTAVRQLIEKIENSKVVTDATVLPVKYVPGHTCAQAAR